MGGVLEAGAGCSIEELNAVEPLEQMSGEWSALWERCPDATPFQSPGWSIPWWRHLGEGELCVLALRQQGRLAALAPFYIRKTGSGLREVLLLGTGITAYLDLLLEPAMQGEGLRLIFEHLQFIQNRWDLCDFQQLRAGSALLEAAAPPGWCSALTAQEVCPVLELPKPGDGLASRIPAHTLGKLSYSRRRLKRLAPLQMERAGRDNFKDLFATFLRLHQRRCEARGEGGVVADAPLQRFHQEAARRLLEAGVLRLYALRTRERIVASQYGFFHQGRTMYYLSGFDPEVSAFSPGALMIGHAIDEAVREGAQEFDFLRGRESYKYLWGAKGRLNCRRRFTRAVPR